VTPISRPLVKGREYFFGDAAMPPTKTRCDCPVTASIAKSIVSAMDWLSKENRVVK
jgi:hypothetical protein